MSHDLQAHAHRFVPSIADTQAVIRHIHGNGTAFACEFDVDVPGLPVLRRIINGFLGDSKEVGGRTVVFDPHRSVAYKPAIDAVDSSCAG
jgi:hypothetical protein